MPRQRRRLSESGIYHVMLRGVNRGAVFLEDDDYCYFLGALARTMALSGCSVLAYCLMPNHVHLVLRTADEQIGDVIRRLGVRYAGWFNRKYSRVGHLFQDRFRSEPVDSDAYVVTLLRYVWNNPVEAGLVDRAEDYPWSSRRHLGARHWLVDHDSLAGLFGRGQLAEVAAPRTAWPESRRAAGRRPRISDEQAQQLLVRCCGASHPEDFVLLEASAQRRVIHDLYARSVSYRQLARLTGFSTSQVQRIQVAGAAGNNAA